MIDIHFWEVKNTKNQSRQSLRPDPALGQVAEGYRAMDERLAIVTAIVTSAVGTYPYFVGPLYFLPQYEITLLPS